MQLTTLLKGRLCNKAPVAIKLLLYMKMTAVILLAATLHVSATGIAQKVTLNYKNVPVKKVFKEIIRQTGTSIIYKEAVVEGLSKISITVKDVTVQEALNICFKDLPYGFKVVNNTIVIYRVEPVAEKKPNPPPSVRITGVVLAEDNSVLSGASVNIKNSSIATVTNTEGKFKLESPESSGVLVVSYVGYATQEVSFSKAAELRIVLVPADNKADEVVVIGYGTQKKVTVTGAIASVNGKVIEKSPLSNFTSSLAGRLPGLIINTRNGDPGNEQVDVFMRGRGSLGSNSVLVVIDGVPGGTLNRLNPADIESVTVLKDASAAIYGAQAANGVILVTTKRGKSGKPTINYSGNYAVTQPTRLLDLMDSWQYAVAENEYLINNGLSAKWTDQDITLFKNGTDPLQHPNVDWYSTTLRKWTPQQQHNISVSGGGEAMRYFLSGQILDQDRYFKNNDDLGLNRYQIRANIDATITKFLSIGLDMNYNKNLIENAYDGNARVFWQTRSMFPNWPAIYPNGLPGPVAFGQNPALMGSSSKYGYNRENTFGFSTRLFYKLDLSIITKGLYSEGFAYFVDGSQNFEKFFRKSYFYNYDPSTDKYIQFPAGQTTQNPELSETNNRNSSKTFNFKLGYIKRVGDHSFDLFAAAEKTQSQNSGFSAYRKDFLTDQLVVLSAGSDVGKDNTGYKSDAARLNYFGRLNYTFKNRYLLSATLRYDGSQNFPEGNRFGLFPGASVGWIMSNENFFKNVKAIDFMKLRASWGRLGNDAVPPYQYLATYASGGGYYFGMDNTIRYTGYAQATTPNPDITWEVADTKNIGFDARIWNALGITFDYFISTRSNILTKKNLSTPDYTGLRLPDVNIGEVRNQGFEISLNYRNTIGKKFGYTLDGNFSFAKNKILFFDESPNVPSYQKLTGYPIGSYLLYQADGIYQNQDQINNTAHLPNTAPGDIKYLDVNKDGQIDGSDMVRETKTPTPEIMYGFNIGVSYSNFELNVFFQGSANNSVRLIPEGLYMDKTFFDGRWTKGGDDIYPRSFNSNRAAVGNNALNSTFWMKNGSFLRLKNVELAYSLPEKLIQSLKIKNLRLFISASNLLLIKDHIKIVDPETLQNGSDALATYPITRMINGGVNIKF